MNAYGIAAGTAPSGSVNGNASGSSPGSTNAAGSAGGFAGMLVQVIGGTQGASAQASSQGMPVGLIGMMGLLGQASSETGSAELLDLLNGLQDQLSKLDPQTEMPRELQEQLAALLLMLQNLLQSPDAIGQTGMDLESGMAGNPLTGDENPAGQQQQVPGGMQAIVRVLRQSVQQLTDRLMQGESFPVQQIALAEPVRQTLESLRQIASAQQSATNASPSADQQEPRAAGDSNIPVLANKTSPRNGQATESVKAQSVIRPSSFAMRNPVWASGVPASAPAGQTTAELANLPTESTDSAGQNQAVPLWTLLKGEQVAIPSGGQASFSAPAQVPVQQFAEQMGKFLIKQFVLTQGNGATEAKISLHPEHLGQVDVKIMIQNGLLTAKFMTDNGAARDLLEAQMSQLRSALQGQGLQVDKMEVVQQSSVGAASFFGQQQRQQSPGQQENQAGHRRSGDRYDDAAEFELELERTAFLREIGFGSSLNVTA